MLGRGSFSFVAMLVINPIVILFYQNCSMTPVSQAAHENPAPLQQERMVSSVMAPEANPQLCMGRYAYYLTTDVE